MNRTQPALLCILALLTSASAATLHWDGNSTTPANADGGAGTWDTLLANWDSAAYGGSDAVWSNAVPDSAVFGGVAGIVTLGEPITVAGLQFNTTGYTVTAASNALSFAATGTPILFNSVNAAAITGAVGGAGGLFLASTNPSATRTLTLNGTSTNGWGGATTVNPGMTLSVDGPNRALGNTSGITIKGGSLSYNNILSAQAGLNFISDTAPIRVVGGGAIIWRPVNAGPTYVENIGAVTVGHGQVTLNTGTLSSGRATLTLPGPVTREDPTVALSFSLANGGVPTSVNRIQITGAGTTTNWVGGASSNPILGPWATTGTSAGVPDYAVLNGDFVAASATAASPEDTWNNSTNAFHSGTAAVALSGSRAMAALRNTAATATLTLSDGTVGHTLATDGILNAAGTVFTVAPGLIPGSLTANGTGGGRLFLSPVAGAITVSAPIVDNGGAVSLVKSGGNTLTLSSTNSTFTGGVVLNAGTVAITSDANLGAPDGDLTFNGIATLGFTTATPYALAASRTLTLNEGSVATFTSGNAAKTILGPVVGSGNLFFNATTTLSLQSTNNTFTGTITAVTAGTTTYGLEMASISDAPGVGLVNLGGGTSGGSFRWIKPGGGATTLHHRQFALSGTTGGGVISALGATPAENLIIRRDLLVTGVGNKTLTLAGGNTGANIFAGNIPDDNDGGPSVISLTKVDAGNWALGGTNAYTGATTVRQGTLIFQGAASVSPGTAITLNHTSGTSGAIRLLDDSGTVTLPNTLNVHTQNSTGNHAVLVGNNGTANGGAGSGTTTGGTFSLASLVFAFVQGDTQFQSVNVTGADGYRLRINGVVLNNLVSRTAGATTESRLNASTANLSVGDITMAAGNTGIANDGVPRLVLTGTATGNEVTGVISDAPDAATGQPLPLTKNGAGNWTLHGTNTYTGVTTVGAGKLFIHGDHSAATGTVTVAATATLGGRGHLGGDVSVATNGRLEFNLSTSAAGHNPLDLAAGRTFTFAGASSLAITTTGGASPGLYTLVSAPGGFTGSAPATLSLPPDWVATVAFDIDGKNLVLDVTSTGTPGGYGDWQAANGTSQPVDGDHDGDGVANGIEWFVHGAGASSGPDASPGVFSDESGLVVVWTKHPDFPGTYGVEYVVESADAPQGPWTPETLGGQVEIVGDEVRYTFATPLPVRKYAQLKVNGP